MLVDSRIEKLAYNLVNYSCDVKEGENVFIEATGVDYQLVACLVKEISKKGAFPYVSMKDNRIE